jgi:hypothetical protein
LALGKQWVGHEVGCLETLLVSTVWERFVVLGLGQEKVAIAEQVEAHTDSYAAAQQHFAPGDYLEWQFPKYQLLHIEPQYHHQVDRQGLKLVFQEEGESLW